MKVIGYWMENLWDDQFILPHFACAPMDDNIRKEIVDYLRAGQVIDAYYGFSWCRFRCGIDAAEMGAGELTDGVWRWPAGLVHYVEKHNISLPPEFIKSVLDKSETCGMQHTECRPDEFDWIAWSRSLLPASFHEMLSCVRREATGRADILLKNKMASSIEKHGIGDRKCSKEGCIELALEGLAYCPKHWVLREGTIIEATEIYDEVFSALIDLVHNSAQGNLYNDLVVTSPKNTQQKKTEPKQ